MNPVLIFLKKYWMVILGVVLAVGFYLNQKGKFEELIEIQHQAQQAEVKVMKDLHEKQIEERNKLIEDNQIRLIELERKYIQSRQALAFERKNKIQIIIKESPEKVAKRLEDAYGFVEWKK